MSFRLLFEFRSYGDVLSHVWKMQITRDGSGFKTSVLITGSSWCHFEADRFYRRNGPKAVAVVLFALGLNRISG